MNPALLEIQTLFAEGWKLTGEENPEARAELARFSSEAVLSFAALRDFVASLGALRAQPACRRCGAPMIAGRALQNTVHAAEDDLGGDAVTMSLTGPAVLVDCWKCPQCGHSISR